MAKPRVVLYPRPAPDVLQIGESLLPDIKASRFEVGAVLDLGDLHLKCRHFAARESVGLT